MFLRMAGLSLAAVLWLSCAGANAHDAGEQDSPAILDCDDPPQHAVRVIPEPLARWTQIECTPVGQMLVQSEDWIWRYPGSFTDRPFLPAWMSADPHVSPNPRYFKSLDVRQAQSEEARALRERIAKSAIDLPAAKPDGTAERVYVVVAETNFGEKLEVNFMYRSDQDIWAVPCAPECRPEQVFHIYRRQ
jgi:hypothetical protein